jgi:hypothetical protein
MTTNLAAVAAPAPVAASLAAGESAGFEERWAAWQAKNAARDLAFRRKMAVAAPILIIVAAIAAYALLGR